MSKLSDFVVLYRIESLVRAADHPFGFICKADDSDHAEEQCLNAYPECDVVWVEQTNSYENALEKYWEI